MLKHDYIKYHQGIQNNRCPIVRCKRLANKYNDNIRKLTCPIHINCGYCKDCKKIFTKQTLSDWDGKRCKRCYFKNKYNKGKKIYECKNIVSTKTILNQFNFYKKAANYKRTKNNTFDDKLLDSNSKVTKSIPDNVQHNENNYIHDQLLNLNTNEIIKSIIIDNKYKSKEDDYIYDIFDDDNVDL